MVLHGQALNSYNINSYNGLPSNCVYQAMSDRHGYLWICTPNGVVRYNGYTFKTFNLAEGLPYEDIWELFEDKKGRIWLCNTSGSIGYLYNNKYHSVYLKDIKGTIYPKDIKNFGGGIIFHSPYISGSQQSTICVENNDTIYRFDIDKAKQQKIITPGIKFENFVSDSLLNKYDHNNYLYSIALVINANGGLPYIVHYNHLYSLGFNKGKFTVNKVFRLPDPANHIQLSSGINFSLNNFLISFETVIKKNTFLTIDLRSGRAQNVDINSYEKNEKVIRIFYNKTNNPEHIFYVITESKVLEFECNNDVKYRKTYFINELLNNAETDGNKLYFFTNNSFWGTCLGTNNNGLVINYNLKTEFVKKNDLILSNYKYLGGITDSIYFWWNEATMTLVKIQKDKPPLVRKYTEIARINRIVHFHQDTFFIGGVKNYMYVNTSGEILNTNILTYGAGIRSVIVKNPEDIFVTTTTGFYEIFHKNGENSRRYFDTDRFNELEYDSIRKNFLAYNYDALRIHGDNLDTLISSENLYHFGIKKIEKIAVDNNYGNIFIKGTNNVVMYNFDNDTYKEIFPDFNLSKSGIYVYKNKLIVIGQFGIICSKILGKQKISAPIFYPNVKNSIYNQVYDYQIGWGKILLNTDKGLYETPIPEDYLIPNSDTASVQAFSYKFLLNYKDSVYSLKSIDTVYINQADLLLQFDIVNPMGNGQLKFSYAFADDSGFSLMNANELTLPQLAPDEYHKLSIKAYDNVWKSGQKDIYLYVVPNWWQTHTGRRIVWVCIIAGILLVLTTSVLITRKLVLSAAKKRHLRMELELKSIYAQINPHFIFNSLNSALLLVNKNKMEEAYTHISKFSRLLRAYIKSSRNKYISIAQEAANLKDYVELQQTRFKNRFSYDITIHESIRSNHVMIPSLLIQPFVENAINHGLLPKQDAGHLQIEFRFAQTSNELLCIIEDDGIGRKNAKATPEIMPHKDESYGDLLIKDLVSIFNKYEHMNIEIAYTDKAAPLTGTIVTIHIKNPQYAK